MTATLNTINNAFLSINIGSKRPSDRVKRAARNGFTFHNLTVKQSMNGSDNISEAILVICLFQIPFDLLITVSSFISAALFTESRLQGAYGRS